MPSTCNKTPYTDLNIYHKQLQPLKFIDSRANLCLFGCFLDLCSWKGDSLTLRMVYPLPNPNVLWISNLAFRSCTFFNIFNSLTVIPNLTLALPKCADGGEGQHYIVALHMWSTLCAAGKGDANTLVAITEGTSRALTEAERSSKTLHFII